MADVKNQLEDAAAQVLTGAIDAATKGAEFLKDQIPDLLKQLLAWHLASDLLFQIIPVVLIFLACKYYPRLWKWDDDGMPSFFVGSIGGCLTLGTTVIGICKAFDALEICVAPKVWLLEYGVSLIHGR